MSDARSEILARIARTQAPDSVDLPIAAASGSVRDWWARSGQFATRARAAAATVATVARPGDVEVAIADYLARQGLPPVVHVSGAPAGLAASSRLQVSHAPLPDDGAVLVSDCLAAVADEGVVVLASGSSHRPESAFLAATHIVVVRPEQLLDSLGSLWSLLRPLQAAALPRMVNLVLGPSRTADLGVPSRLGAHGPLRVHVVLIEDTPPARQ